MNINQLEMNINVTGININVCGAVSIPRVPQGGMKRKTENATENNTRKGFKYLWNTAQC